MCGIAGFSRFNNPIGDRETLITMGDAIRHRGPDADGTYLDESIGLHHRRLAIIDLSDAGTQPMRSVCGRYVVVFNGEIYNFKELRETLIKQGQRFRTKTDTEVILAAYAIYGKDCVKHFNGMFAIALWDTVAETLFLARDRIGKKPLYYCFQGGDIVFASELKALIAAGLIKKNIRMDALYDFFAYQYVPDPKTIFENVYKLEPGHYATVSHKGLNIRQYWDISFRESDMDENTAIEELKEHIDRSTRLRMVSDVPLGAFLSGGVDSGGIVATMARNSAIPITTCTIGFNEEAFDESDFARLVANQYNCDHHEFTVGEEIIDSLREITQYFDEPFADPSLVPTYFVCKLARQKVTVALAGDGGDEVFAGYEKYHLFALENLWRRRLPGFVKNSVLPMLVRLLEESSTTLSRKASTFSRAMSADPALGFYMTNAQITDSKWNHLASESTKETLSSYHPSQRSIEMFARCDAKDILSRALYTDMKTFLPGDILVKVDRMSMAHSLEVRAPLLDYRLMEFASVLAPRMKYLKGAQKRILKRALEPVIPQQVRERKKMGFSPPTALWLRGPLKTMAESLLFDKNTGSADLFSLAEIHRLWNEHQTGRQDHSHIIWSLLSFQLWFQSYMKGN